MYVATLKEWSSTGMSVCKWYGFVATSTALSSLTWVPDTLGIPRVCLTGEHTESGDEYHPVVEIVLI